MVEDMSGQVGQRPVAMAILARGPHLGPIEPKDPLDRNGPSMEEIDER